jgi:hypothetical protein
MTAHYGRETHKQIQKLVERQTTLRNTPGFGSLRKTPNQKTTDVTKKIFKHYTGQYLNNDEHESCALWVLNVSSRLSRHRLLNHFTQPTKHHDTFYNILVKTDTWKPRRFLLILPKVCHKLLRQIVFSSVWQTKQREARFTFKKDMVCVVLNSKSTPKSRTLC